MTRSTRRSSSCSTPAESLEKFLGAALGSKVGALAANQDHRKVQPNGRAGSVGAQSAFGRREPDDDLLRTVALSDMANVPDEFRELAEHDL